jgi:LPS sulfotransferase NodH
MVVREEQREGTLVYVLHIAPGADQYVLRRREDAVAQAVTFAKRQHVRAWLTDEGYDFVLLEDFRVMESV